MARHTSLLLLANKTKVFILKFPPATRAGPDGPTVDFRCSDSVANVTDFAQIAKVKAVIDEKGLCPFRVTCRYDVKVCEKLWTMA